MKYKLDTSFIFNSEQFELLPFFFFFWLGFFQGEKKREKKMGKKKSFFWCKNSYSFFIHSILVCISECSNF